MRSAFFLRCGFGRRLVRLALEGAHHHVDIEGIRLHPALSDVELRNAHWVPGLLDAFHQAHQLEHAHFS
jgi:hypothetical protein